MRGFSHHDCRAASTSLCGDLRRLWYVGDTLGRIALATVAVTLLTLLLAVYATVRPGE